MNPRYVAAVAAITDQAVRAEVSGVLASADRISRHAPIHLAPEAIEALWLAYVVVLDTDNRDRVSEAARQVLGPIAAGQVDTVGAALDMHGLTLGESAT